MCCVIILYLDHYATIVELLHVHVRLSSLTIAQVSLIDIFSSLGKTQKAAVR